MQARVYYFAAFRASIFARFFSNRLREALCQFLCLAILLSLTLYYSTILS